MFQDLVRIFSNQSPHFSMESRSNNFFTRNGEAIIHTLKAIFISLTLTMGAIIIHLEHSTTTNDHHHLMPPSSYMLTVSLVKATEQLQDAISLILSNYSAADSDIDAELAWKSCSGSVLNGWGEIQDAMAHVMMNPFVERGEMRRQMVAAEGFIAACVGDLEKVESTAASEVRGKLLVARVYLRGRGEFVSSNSGEIWRRVVGMMVAIVLENLFCIIFCGVQLFFILYIFQKLVKFRYN